MDYFVLKTEPGTYSFDRLLKDGTTVWDGISNPAARGHLRTARKGDRAFIYHTGDERQIVGLAEITGPAREDPKQPGLTADNQPKFPVVTLKALRAVKSPFTLAEIKADPRFADFGLVRLSRLSVIPVPKELVKIILDRTGLA